MKQNFNPEIWLVERRQFNPAQWLNTPANQTNKSTRQKSTAVDIDRDTSKTPQKQIAVLLERIEKDRVDITAKYQAYLKICFALADEFGEAGRREFHRFSAFHPEYNRVKCNKQFDFCLKGSSSKAKPATLKTIFSLAMEAGVDVKI